MDDGTGCRIASRVLLLCWFMVDTVMLTTAVFRRCVVPCRQSHFQHLVLKAAGFIIKLPIPGACGNPCYRAGALPGSYSTVDDEEEARAYWEAQEQSRGAKMSARKEERKRRGREVGD